MIDFKQKRSMGRYGCEGLEEWNALNGYAAKVREDLEASKTNFFWLGVHLIDLYSSDLYRLTFDREKLGVSGIVDNCSAECFFAYCYDEFGLDKTQVSTETDKPPNRRLFRRTRKQKKRVNPVGLALFCRCSVAPLPRKDGIIEA